MELPHYENATVPQEKILSYLLSSTHRAGKSKAAFFTAHGFQTTQWRQLVEALCQHAKIHPVAEHEQTSFGTRFIIEGSLATPDGQRISIRSIWFIDKGSDQPRFVTAYPMKRKGL